MNYFIKLIEYKTESLDKELLSQITGFDFIIDKFNYTPNPDKWVDYRYCINFNGINAIVKFTSDSTDKWHHAKWFIAQRCQNTEIYKWFNNTFGRIKSIPDLEYYESLKLFVNSLVDTIGKEYNVTYKIKDRM